MDLDPGLERFGEVGREFCRTIEQVSNLPRSEFLSRVQSSLLNLYAVVFEMPWAEAETKELEKQRRELTMARIRRGLQGEPPDPEMAHRFRLLDQMENLLGTTDIFRETNDPTLENPTIIEATISVSLHDTYESVSEALHDLEGGARPRDIVDRLKWGFVLDWGRHGVDTLRVIHFLMVDYWLRAPEG